MINLCMKQSAALTVIMSFVVFGAGCSKSSVQIAGEQTPLPKGESSAAFLDRISNQPNVSQNDAMRGVLFLLDGKDDSSSFQQRVESLIERNIIPSGWNYRPDESITRGKLAYMLCQACNIKDSLMLTIAGPSQRYCLRELQHKGFFASGVIYAQVSGMEFVAALTRADVYIETGNVPRIISTSQY